MAPLHGKSEPSAMRGLLSGLPYGGGVAITMCPWAVPAKKARAETARMLLIECMSGLSCVVLAEV